MRSVIEAATMSIAVCAHARGLRYHCGAARESGGARRQQRAPLSLVAEAAASGEFKRGTKGDRRCRQETAGGALRRRNINFAPDKTEARRRASAYCGNINPGQS